MAARPHVTVGKSPLSLPAHRALASGIRVLVSPYPHCTPRLSRDTVVTPPPPPISTLTPLGDFMAPQHPPHHGQHTVLVDPHWGKLRHGISWVLGRGGWDPTWHPLPRGEAPRVAPWHDEPWPVGAAG